MEKSAEALGAEKEKIGTGASLETKHEVSSSSSGVQTAKEGLGQDNVRPGKRKRAEEEFVDGHLKEVDGTVHYLLDVELQEKESSVYDQVPVLKRYGEDVHERPQPVLTEKAEELAAKFFEPFAKQDTLPNRPDGSGRKGFYMRNEDFVALRGVGGKDMAKIWHMLVIPTLKKDAKRKLRWVCDLTREDLPLLERMKKASLDFVRLNENYFRAKEGESVLEKSMDHWLDPNMIELGFHVTPSVGYLHVHVLVGPLTEFGANQHNSERWIPLDEIIAKLTTHEQLTPSLLAEPETEQQTNKRRRIQTS